MQDVLPHRLAPHLLLRQRSYLETDDGYLQLLPGVTFVRVNDDGDITHVYAYRRTKKVGEQRLGGKVSIIVGGHIEFDDLIMENPGVIDFLQTVDDNLHREIEEEVVFDAPSKLHLENPLEGVVLSPKYRGLILDLENEVGRCHVGVHHFAALPEHVEVRVVEETLDNIGFIPVEEFLDPNSQYQGQYEGWAEIVRHHLKTHKTEIEEDLRP